MNKKGHRKTTRAVIDMFQQRYGTTVLVVLKEFLAGMCAFTDDLQDVEFVDVETGRDNPHESSWSDDDDIATFKYGSRTFTAFNHFIDIRRGPGKFDDYDGYNYSDGSGHVGESQSALEIASGCKEEFVAAITGYKVDEGIMFWFNDEYVHAPGHKWYDNCSPSLERYSYWKERGIYRSLKDEMKARFPLADSTGKKGKGVPYSTFMPVDNLARYHYENYIGKGPFSAIAFALHGIMDCSIPQHAAGCMGNWHTAYENFIDAKIEEYTNGSGKAKFQKDVFALVDLWNQDDPRPPLSLAPADRDRTPARNWRTDMLATWLALHAYHAYERYYFQTYRINYASVRELCLYAVAMSLLVLIRSHEARPARFFGNTKTRELHHGECHWLKLIHKDHIKMFDTLEDARGEHFDGCGHCLGPSLSKR